MLSPFILDRLIPLPTEDALVEQIKTELAAEGFPITNFKNGGIFYTLLRVFVRIKIELLDLARSMISNGYASSADSAAWLDVKGYDFAKLRKQPIKAQGTLTLTRTVATAAVKIPSGCIFKTIPDASGESLRFFATGETVFKIGETMCAVPIVAETAGAAYNVPAGKITQSLIHLETVVGITNAADWLAREGADIEDIERFRARILNSFADLATNPTRDKYKSVCEAVAGVLAIGVNDQHPRGQGTVDIIVTSSTGDASSALLADVKAAAETIAGPYDNLLVKASETVRQDISITVILPASVSAEGIPERTESVVRALFALNRSRVLSELYLSDLIVAVRLEIPTAKSVRVTAPAADVILATDKVIVPGTVAVTVERG